MMQANDFIAWSRSILHPDGWWWGPSKSLWEKNCNPGVVWAYWQGFKLDFKWEMSAIKPAHDKVWDNTANWKD